MAIEGSKLNLLYQQSLATGVGSQENWVIVNIDTWNERTLYFHGVDYFVTFGGFTELNNLIFQDLTVYRNLKIDFDSVIAINTQIANGLDSGGAERVWGMRSRGSDIGSGRDFAIPMRLGPAGVYSFVHHYVLGGPPGTGGTQGLTVRGELKLEPPGSVEYL